MGARKIKPGAWLRPHRATAHFQGLFSEAAFAEYAVLNFRKWFWPLMAVVIVTGCKTAPDRTVTNPAPVFEVVQLPDTRPPVLGQDRVETNQPPPVLPPTPTPTPPPATAFRWPTNSAHPGWIAFDTWSALNHLPGPQRRRTGMETSFTVPTPQGAVTIQIGSRIALWDGQPCWLGYAPQLFNGQPHLALVDAAKTLQPLLQPAPPITKTGRVIVLDPGHGGADNGTSGAQRQLEKHLALDWALRLQELLRTNGWKVVLTRTTDTNVPLAARVTAADLVNADLFISLHFNSGHPNLTHAGIETYCLTPVGLPSTLTRNFEDNPRQIFPNNLFDRENVHYAFRLQRELIRATHANNGGVRRARFMGVLRGQTRPAVLIEGGYLSNPAEARLIATPAYRQKLAEAVARALE